MRILAFVIAIALIAFMGVCYYAGIFDDVTVSFSETGPYNVVYREHKGPYKAVRYVIGDVGRFLSEKKKAVPQKGFAIFYDNPRKIKSDELRSIGGYITDSLAVDLPAPYKSEVVPKARCVVGVFPLRSFLSIMTGPMKFYPEMLTVLAHRKQEAVGPVMEIYNLPEKKILYIAPLK